MLHAFPRGSLASLQPTQQRPHRDLLNAERSGRRAAISAKSTESQVNSRDRNPSRRATPFSALAGLLVVWAVIYLMGGLQGAIAQAYWSVIIQVVVAGLVLRLSRWPEPPKER